MVTLHSPDLDIKKIAESGQCFRMDETGTGHYTLVAMGHVLEMDALPGGCVLHCTVKQYEEIWKAYFDMETDYAAFRAAIDKLRGVHGTFYKIAGDEVYGLDGFFGHDIEEYAEMGIRIPADPDGVCNKVFQETGVVSMIVDANALAQEILGKCDALRDWPDETLSRLIGDNPAGQVRQLTPFILIREVPQEEAAELEARAQAEIAARGEGAL